MNEVEKMRSGQLADMSVPEMQVRFERAEKLLAPMTANTGLCSSRLCRVFLPHPLFVLLSIVIMVTVSGWANMCLLMPIVHSWMAGISLSEHIL